ncbi:ferritin-like domain-containing protein [Lichenibacterium ramalinae]|uniref:Ferritin-like domain-containing protein n=1 Tax=Lichenibacterium ramalinae TaxID=2316527 RepID=A0A4Q2R9G6_9HYPH|nr:ferritin-like domain-containing protein [Lichenibacterium ramalinae]RYB02787.1 ferritin-like domain-containing protein [Lichenibacterium ramalinae]
MSDQEQHDGAGSQRPINLEAGRRAFLKTAGMGTALAALATVTSGEAQAQTADFDVAILNFALNLEYLEAEFYQRAVYGVGLDASLTGGIGTQGGGVRGGSKVPFKNTVVQNIAAEIANDEKNHVIFLKSALGSKAVAEPIISLDSSFTALAAAAGLPSGFNPYADDFSFLLAAYVFEDVGTTAYNGAAPFITNKTYLGAAASILAVEAYHAATIRTLLFSQQNQFFNNATALISKLRATLSGAQDDQAIGADQSTLAGGFPSPANITPADANGLVFARTPRQVLNVVYGGVNASKGVFFPEGANGGPGFSALLKATGG